MVADALSKKSYCNHIVNHEQQLALFEQFENLNLEIVPQGSLSALEVHPTLEERIKVAQVGNTSTERLQQLMERGKASKMMKDDQGILWYGKHIFVPHHQDLKELIFKEAHELAYSIHPGGTKMY